MTDPALVEEVARAIDETPEWPAKTYRERIAQAALSVVRKALETPTEEMASAAFDAMPGSVKSKGVAHACWVLMFRASPLYRRG